jgi:hypothetical protein
MEELFNVMKKEIAKTATEIVAGNVSTTLKNKIVGDNGILENEKKIWIGNCNVRIKIS